MKKILAAVALSAVFIAPSHAGAVYTTSASFLSQVQSGAYTESFSVNHADSALITSRNYSGNGYSFTAFSLGGLYDNGSFLGALNATRSLVLTFTGNAINAIGGNFFNTDTDDNFANTSITVSLSNGTTQSYAPSSFATSYRGFTTDVFITSLTLTSTTEAGWVSLGQPDCRSCRRPGRSP
jgi:hypothetical protein